MGQLCYPVNRSIETFYGDIDIITAIHDSEYKIFKQWLQLKYDASFSITLLKSECIHFIFKSLPILHTLCFYGHLKLLKLLLKRDNNVETVDRYGNAAIHYGVHCSAGYVCRFDKCLCKHSGQRLVVIGGDPRRFCPKCKPEIIGLKCLKILIRYNVNINSTNNMGDTAIFIAAKRANLNIMAYLIKKGANCLVTDEYYQSLLHILCNSNSYISHSLLRYTDHERVKLFSVRMEMILVRTLIKKGIDINLQDRIGYTALHYAVKKSLLDTAIILILHGANANLKSFSGESVLFTFFRYAFFGKTICYILLSTIIEESAPLCLYNSIGQPAINLSSFFPENEEKFIVHLAKEVPSLKRFCRQVIRLIICPINMTENLHSKLPLPGHLINYLIRPLFPNAFAY